MSGLALYVPCRTADVLDGSCAAQVLRALGLQCKVTPETFIQLARHIAVSAAALAAAGAIATTPRLRSNSSASSSTAAGPSSSAGLSDGTAYAATASPAYSDVSSADATQVASLVAAADALLSHLRSQWTGLGPEKAFWRELGQVQFVPATLGLPGKVLGAGLGGVTAS